MTLTTQLVGIEKALYMAIDNQKMFTDVLEFATEVVTGFGLAQLKAGVHLPIVFDPSSTPTVIPPQFYREFIAPCLKRVFDIFKSSGSLINWLHTAGPVEPILSYYPQMGVELANIDFCVDPLTAMQLLPNISINGNLKPFSFVDDTAGEIAEKAATLLDIFADRGGFILSTGCEMPLEAKPENIVAMVEAAKST
jgi:uroporphyrinogen decarboxylase